MPGAGWEEIAEPIIEECRVQLRLIKRGTFTELLIYLETEDEVVRPFVEKLKELAVVDLHGLPPGNGEMWPDGCVKIRIRMDDD